MREFTKSMMSYTWAMSLFGVQQMANIFRPSAATESFDNVTEATEDEFGGALKATFRAGDNLQRGLVDLTFSLFTLGMFDRRGASRTTSDAGCQTGDAFRRGMRAMGQAADVVGEAVQGAAYATADAAQQGAGWASASNAGRAARAYACCDDDDVRGDAGRRARRQATPGAERAPGAGQSRAGGGQAQGWGPMPSQSSGGSSSRR
jgi:hypothetical protein